MAGKILIADDSLKIQKQLTELLEAKGIEVTAVSNGEFAVRKLPDVQPDLVLADIFMPVRTGYEVCEFIKQSEEFSHIPVLLLASTLEPYDEAEAERVGIDGKIEKPIADADAAMETILEFLNRSLGGDTATPVVDADEFAAAVPEAAHEDELETIVVPPAVTEPEPEPDAIPAAAAEPEPVTFDDSETPMGFADLEEGAAPAAGDDAAEEGTHDEPFAAALGEDEPADAPAETPAHTHDPDSMVDVAGFREEADADEEEFSMDTIASQADAVETQPEPAPAAEAEPELISGAENAVDAPAREIEKAELAAPWEMTEAPEGAPEIRQAGGWEGQDWDELEGPILPPGERLGPSQEEISSAEEPTESEAETTEEEPAEEAEGAGERFSPEALAAIFDQAEAEVEAEEAAAADSPAEMAEPAASAGDANLDAMVEEIAKKVVEHLPPEVLEKLSRDLAKEIARPLAEKLIKDKLSE